MIAACCKANENTKQQSYQAITKTAFGYNLCLFLVYIIVIFKQHVGKVPERGTWGSNEILCSIVKGGSCVCSFTKQDRLYYCCYY